MKHPLFIALFAFAVSAVPFNLVAEDQEPTDADKPAVEASEPPAAPEESAQPAESKPAAPEISEEKPAPAEKPAAASSSKEKKITTLDLKGEIESINAEERTLTVAGKTFKFWKTGKVFFRRQLKSLADLKVGDKVAITYREKSDGTLEASRVNK